MLRQSFSVGTRSLSVYFVLVHCLFNNNVFVDFQQTALNMALFACLRSWCFRSTFFRTKCFEIQA